MGAGQTVVAFCKVAIEGRDDRILAVGVVDMTGPLTDTGTACIGEDDAADLVEGLQKSILFDGKADLLGTGGNGEFRLYFEFLIDRLPGEGCRAADIFVRRVGAG